MTRKFAILVAILPLSCLLFMVADANQGRHKLNLPTSKALTVPVPGFIGRTNSYPATIALSPDGRYAALLNQGYGTEQSEVRQSIVILELSNNQMHDFPDDRLRGDEKSTLQSYFLGLAFSSDGKHLYASMASTSQNGIAVYGFVQGQVTPERFITIPPQGLAQGKKLTFDAGKNPPGTVPPYPAGLAILRSAKSDRLLVANNLSDNVVLLDVASGRILKSFDVSISQYVPAAYPYTVVANHAGTKAWVSLWNGSAVAELDIKKGEVKRRIELWRPSDPVAPGTHPTAMLLNRSEDLLYVAMANAPTTESDGIAVLQLKKRGLPPSLYQVSDDAAPGAASIAIALSPDEKFLYAAAASLNAVAVFETKPKAQRSESNGRSMPMGFIPTEWYPSALAIVGNDLLIASAKGDSSGPNNMAARVQTALHPNPHPYIATLIGGSIQRLSREEIDRNLPAYTRQVEENNLLHVDPERIAFVGGLRSMVVRDERLAGYSLALREAGVPFEESLVIETMTNYSGGGAAAPHLLNLHEPATAALCYNDVVAIGLVRAFTEAGISVGKDFAVIGFDDIEEAKYTLPALSSVAVNGRNLGSRAAQLLMRQLASGDFEPETVLSPTTLVIRASCGASDANNTSARA